MHTVLIVIHLMVVVALVGVILLQRSEGGALGMGGGGGGGLMSARGAANALTRVTAVLALIFFVTSLSLGILAKYSGDQPSLFDKASSQAQSDGKAGEKGTGGGILDQLPKSNAVPSGDGAAKTDGEPAVPNSSGEKPADASAGTTDDKASEKPADGEPAVPSGQ